MAEPAFDSNFLLSISLYFLCNCMLSKATRSHHSLFQPQDGSDILLSLLWHEKPPQSSYSIELFPAQGRQQWILVNVLPFTQYYTKTRNTQSPLIHGQWDNGVIFGVFGKKRSWDLEFPRSPQHSGIWALTQLFWVSTDYSRKISFWNLSAS